MIVRSLVHRLGFRYRLHKKDLPGKPDIVLVRRRKIVDVRGCFFHMHTCKYGRVVPATNAEFWQAKLSSNVERDKRNSRELKKAGWKVLVVWECETRNQILLERKVRRFLDAEVPEIHRLI